MFIILVCIQNIATGKQHVTQAKKQKTSIKTIHNRMLLKLTYFYGRQLVQSVTSTSKVFVLFFLTSVHFSPISQENLCKPSQCRLTLPCKFNILQQDCRELLLYKNRHCFLCLCFLSVQQQKLCTLKR